MRKLSEKALRNPLLCARVLFELMSCFGDHSGARIEHGQEKVIIPMHATGLGQLCGFCIVENADERGWGRWRRKNQCVLLGLNPHLPSINLAT